MDFLDRLLGLIEDLLNHLARKALGVIVAVVVFFVVMYFLDASVQTMVQGWASGLRIKP